jgi:hypothetical protein
LRPTEPDAPASHFGTTMMAQKDLRVLRLGGEIDF